MDSTLAFGDGVRAHSPGARSLARTAALLSAACVLGLIEASLPPLPVLPWLRIGIANVAVVVALALSGRRSAVAVSLGRVAIVGLVTGTLASPPTLLAGLGAVFALVAMMSGQRLVPGLSPIGLSALGAAAHMTGQFAAAVALTGSTALLALAPPSVLLALATGTLTGSLASLVVSRLDQLPDTEGDDGWLRV